jgi:hypothetical protein
MNNPHPQNTYQRAAAQDAHLQPDPELALAQSPASTWKTVLAFAAMIFATIVVLYGLNNQRNEMQHETGTPAANAPAPSAPAATPAPTPAQPPQQNTQGQPPAQNGKSSPPAQGSQPQGQSAPPKQAQPQTPPKPGQQPQAKPPEQNNQPQGNAPPK